MCGVLVVLIVIGVVTVVRRRRDTKGKQPDAEKDAGKSTEKATKKDTGKSAKKRRSKGDAAESDSPAEDDGRPQSASSESDEQSAPSIPMTRRERREASRAESGSERRRPPPRPSRATPTKPPTKAPGSVSTRGWRPLSRKTQMVFRKHPEHRVKLVTMSKPIEASIVVVDDEPSIRELLVASLHFAGFDVATAASGSEAIEVIEKTQPDLIVLDVMLPDIDGFTVTRRIRQEGIGAPVLFLTARDDTQDKVMGLTVGGDDYVTKPFSLEEVVARIRAILRRTREQVEDDPIIRVGDLEINEDSHDVSRAGHAIDLSPTEYKLLRYLMDNEGRVLSKAQILDHVWQYDWGGDAAIVESYISYLRKKVDGIMVTDDNGEQHKVTPLIETKRGIGYMIREPRVSA